METLFIQGSPHEDGATARIAAKLIGDEPYETLRLVDLRIDPYGGVTDEDQFGQVADLMRKSDRIVIGSPMYWHSMCGAVRNVLDRTYGDIPEGSLRGRTLWFVFQGAAPTKQQLVAADYTMGRYAALYGMTYGGMVTTEAEAAKAHRRF